MQQKRSPFFRSKHFEADHAAVSILVHGCFIIRIVRSWFSNAPDSRALCIAEVSDLRTRQFQSVSVSLEVSANKESAWN